MEPDLDIFGPFGWETDGGEDWSAEVGIDPLALDAHLGQDLLLIAEPWEVGDASGGDDLDFSAPFGEVDDWGGWETARRMLYVAATTGRSTANDDEPPAQHVAGRLLPWDFGTRLFEGVDPLARAGTNTGVIRFSDPGGTLNGLLLGRNWDSVPLTLKRGPRGTPFKDWPVVGRFRSAGLLRDPNEKAMRVRDLGWQLDSPLHGETFAGTGGLEGDARLTGHIKPWALGYCFNVEPVLLSEADQIVQWSLSSSQACEKFLHGAVPLTFNADHPDFASLAAATIPSGHYDTCLAHSLGRPNVTLQYDIRVDVVGDADVVNGHAGPMTRASIVRRIATFRGSSYLGEASEIDASSFQRMEAYHSAPVGWWFGGETTKAAALNRVLAGVLGWYRIHPDGRLAVGWVEAPELMTPAVTFDFGSHGMGLPRLIETAPPRRGTKIGYRFNEAPQPNRGSLAPGATDEEAAIRGQVARFMQSLRPAIGTLYPTSRIVAIEDSGFRDDSDAGLEAERQQVIFDQERSRWSIDFQIDPFIDLEGSATGLRGAPDVVGEGRAMLCVGVNAAGSSVNAFEFFV